MIEGARATDTGATGLTAVEKARLIYEQARGEMSSQLWNAALGSIGEGDSAPRSTTAPMPVGPLGLDRLLAILSPDPEVPLDVPAMPQLAPAATGSGEALTAMQDGPNARYAGMLDAASARSGIPASALAAIIDAEAAKGAGGTWQPYSRNPRSSAAGLGQFLSRTWEGEAERVGTWLNQTAQARGWLDARGQVTEASRSALLAMRYDPRASIEAVADYASANVKALRRAGALTGTDTVDVAQAAYLGHHLGVGDARRFLAGGLSPDRARRLLGAQLGTAAAERRIARAGSAVAAHRAWLLEYVGKRIRPDRFA